VDAFYLGPAKNYYRCDYNYVPKTQAYRILGSMELFPQLCQLPSLTLHQHFHALTDELTEHTAQANSTPKGRCLLKILGTQIDSLLHLPPILDKQRVIADHQREACEAEQRVMDDSPIITIPQITDAPPILLKHNPMAKWILRTTLRLHCRVTRNNTPGLLPVPNVIAPISTIAANTP
jgi:hypothetical protein